MRWFSRRRVRRVSADRSYLQLHDVIRDVVGRVIAAHEELEIGATDVASTILFDLELDLVAVLEQAASA